MSVSVNIKKDFGAFRLDVSFEAENCVHGLLGASGCGKSMTLRCIAGVLKPDQGKIVINGVTVFDSEKKINFTPQQRRVGLLFQNYALFPNMTVRQNIMAGLHGEKSRAAAETACGDLIERFNLDGMESHRPHQLSGGQQQRVALARILATRPDVLMLDEPFSALDGYLRWQTELELCDILKEFSGTVLLVSHNRDEIYRLCDRVSVLSNGYAEPQISVKELFDTPKTLSACLLSGCKNFSRVKPAGNTSVTALDWGVTLETGQEVEADITHIGVRAHYVALAGEEDENAVICTVERAIDDVFSTVLMLSTPGGNSGYSLLRMELDKNIWRSMGNPKSLTVSMEPKNIMLLRG